MRSARCGRRRSGGSAARAFHSCLDVMCPLRCTKTRSSSKRSAKRSSCPSVAQPHFVSDNVRTSFRMRLSVAIGGPCAVLLVGDMAAPGHGGSRVVVLLHGDVDHEAVGRGAVPVVLAGLEEDAVAGADDLDGTTLAPAQADAFGDEDRLAMRVGVPGGAGAGREVHAGSGEGGGTGGGGDGVDVDVAGEPVGRPLLGVDAAA